MLILFVYTFFIQSKQSSHVFLQNNHHIFCQVAQDRGVSCFSILFAMFMLIWLRYTKVQHNNHKTIFKIIFFAKYLYSLFLAFCNKARNSVFLFLFQLLWNAFCVSLSNWSVKTDQLLFHHCLPKQVILVQVRHITRRDNRHNSMTHDTYDTCFYKCYTRAQEKR